MSQYFTIKDSKYSRKFNTENGEFFVYDLQLLGTDNELYYCYVNQKDTTPEPMIDARVYGDIAQDKRGNPKFTKEQAPDFPHPTTHPTGSVAPSAPATSNYRQQDPEVQKAIIKQSMLKAAVDYVVAKSAKEPDYELSGKHVVQVATYFVAFCEGRMNVTMSPEEVAELFGYEEAEEEKEKKPFDQLEED